jgi:hypothetical protein
MGTIELTTKEQQILDNLSPEKREFFDKHFGKIKTIPSWVTDLKHYDEIYQIDEAIAICEAFNWEY